MRFWIFSVKLVLNVFTFVHDGYTASILDEQPTTLVGIIIQSVSFYRHPRVACNLNQGPPPNPFTAAKAAFEFLASLPEVDAKRIGICGRSFGTFWSMRAAADEPRFAAAAGAVACYYWDHLTIFDEAPIRFKQVFMTMAGMEDEDVFDQMSEGFTLKGHAQRITCPVLMASGEFDPLNPLV